jgi:RNA polymerase sigma-70 factor (ECF subfamily)
MGDTDARLLLAARGGDAASLGVLLESYRPRLLAVAVRLLGDYGRAEDAVQETFVLALRRIGGVRDPAAFGGWLHTVLRNVCLTALRGHDEQPVAELPADSAVARSAEEEFAQLAVGEWVRSAVDRLSEPLRLPLLLRHFSGCGSYDQIASICGVPVGTVRSRLNEGRRRLARELLVAAERGDRSSRLRAEARERRLELAVREMDETGDAGAFAALCSDDVELDRLGERLRGRAHFQRVLRAQREAGVRFQVASVLSGRGVTICEGRFLNPVDDPAHCPPHIVQVHEHGDGLAHRVTLHAV